MGSEVEMIDEAIEEFNDVENTVFVAVGKNVKESKSLISWVLQCFDGMRICLLHIHQPAHLVTLLDDKYKMHKILNQYNLILSQAGVQTGNVWIEADNIEMGIVQTIAQYDIRLLVMGAATSKLHSKDMLEPKSKKAIYVCQQAPKSCQILIVCKGHLTHTRSMKALSPSPAVEETMLSLYHEAGADMAVENSTFEKSVFSPSTSTHLPMDESEDQLVQSLSAMFLKESKGLSSSELHDKLVEYAITDAKNSKQKAFEESIKRWKAEEDLNEALHKAEVSENFCTEENKLRKETETILVTQNQEIKTMKSQRDQLIKELEIVKLQKPELVDRISKARDTEKELEEKIIQAVNLLITFKKRRDDLQNELDNARTQINKLAKYIKNEDNNNTNTNLSHAQFYKPNFLEIMEATQDFNQSLKIGEGKNGSVYKGIICYVKVAIKMLPSVGSQSDAEFENQAEFLSRIRHPNIVTLFGICPENRSIIYEYLENGNLENQIKSLQWQTRIKIAAEICSVLIFLHGNKPQITHGNLTLKNILLDSNHVSKLSDLGINRLILDKDQTSVSVSVSVSVNSDVYSFGIVLLRILTGLTDDLSVVNDAKLALENGDFFRVLDLSGGDWPVEHAEELANLGLRCCEENVMSRPNLVDILTKLESMRNLFRVSSVDFESENHRRIPSYFVCPIFQEVMKDPYIAADGFTYEEDAIKGWLNSGHKTSPMTNLKLDHCHLLPNHALSYAIQEWQQHS